MCGGNTAGFQIILTTYYHNCYQYHCCCCYCSCECFVGRGSLQHRLVMKRSRRKRGCCWRRHNVSQLMSRILSHVMKLVITPSSSSSSSWIQLILQRLSRQPMHVSFCLAISLQWASHGFHLIGIMERRRLGSCGVYIMFVCMCVHVCVQTFYELHVQSNFV